MSSASRPPPRSRRRTDRGTTLLEGLVASAVLLIGLVGALNGVGVATRQNAMANKMIQATAVASQLRSALQNRGFVWLTGPAGPLLAARCAADAETRKLGGEQAVAGACVIDFDAFEDAAPDVAARLMPGYANLDLDRSFRRVLVHTTSAAHETVTIVVSWNEVGRRHFHQQSVVLYNPVANRTLVEI